MCDSGHISSGHIDARHIDVRQIDANVSRVTHVTAKLPNNSTLRCTCLYVKGTTNVGSVTYFRDIFIYGFRDSFKMFHDSFIIHIFSATHSHMSQYQRGSTPIRHRLLLKEPYLLHDSFIHIS